MAIEFTKVPAGTAVLGIDENGRREASALSTDPRIWWESVTPHRREKLRPFSISTAPLSYAEVMDGRPDVTPPAGVSTDQVARVRWEVADEVAHSLGGRLPTEEEWEYACRGGEAGLFAFGQLPESDADLEQWMSWSTSGGPRNGFGLRCLYTGEWCCGTWRLRPDDASTEEEGVRVMRGGGAYFWPWQDEEWVWCMSAARSPSNELPEPEWSFRVVKEVG